MAISLHELNFDKAVDYHYDKFPPNNLDYSLIIGPLAKAVDAIARFDQMLKTMHNSEFLLAPLRNQEAVISSRMEGTVSTVDEILLYEAEYAEGEENEALVRSEVIETILYQRALVTAQKELESGKTISEWLIRSMHAKLLSFGRGAEKSPGQYKGEQNYVVDRSKRNVLFVPVSPEKLNDGMQNLIGYINDDRMQILLRTAIAHVEFEALHPFKDGNGRLGRMLITLMLWQYGVISAPHFYVSGYLEEEKDQYIDSMKAVSQKDDWTSWCVFFLGAMENQAIRNLKIVEDISGLYETMKHVFEDKLGTRWHLRALDFIFGNPYFRNNKFTKLSGIPESTAARFTRILIDEKLLITLQEASGRRPAMYAFEPLLRLVRV
ncbi:MULTISPECIES: Fic family protein [Asticcacaulis]|uniref:Fic family protein n=1 Tax=Asticcacaulis TaxID=76890 RepID=UPI001AEA44CD|nr:MULTISPECIES: Fic family protein [Asticcacaulis]MBP2161284.1 Fic family protein [Asticcacaulis solisilvae]MDR6802350.1 Fic family protein [Asticcacaulis sp. BE141]